MKLSEFIKAPQSAYLFDYWAHPVKVPSPLGEFSVELMPDAGEPDAQMVEEAERIALFVKARPEKLVEKVFEHYTRFLGNSAWLSSCNVPLNLTANTLSSYLHSRTVSVSREGAPDSFQYEGRIYISPQWDVEHGIYLEVSEIGLEFCDA